MGNHEDFRHLLELVPLGWQQQAYLEYLVWLLEVVALLVEKQGRAREKARMEREKVVRDLRVFCLVFLEVKLGRQEKVAKKAKKDMAKERTAKERTVRERAKARIATKSPLDLLFWTLCPTIFLVKSLKLS